MPPSNLDDDSDARRPLRPKDADGRLAELTALLLEEADASAVLAALSGAVDTDTASPAVLALLAELALEAYDVKRAEQYATLALKRDPNSFDAKHIIARAYVAQGRRDECDRRRARDCEAAIRSAARSSWRKRSLRSIAWKRRGASSIACGRLARLIREVDRRLALLAYQGGDFAEAQRRFTELATEQ